LATLEYRVKMALMEKMVLQVKRVPQGPRVQLEQRALLAPRVKREKMAHKVIQANVAKLVLRASKVQRV
jgi:hypothetical protein